VDRFGLKKLWKGRLPALPAMAGIIPIEKAASAADMKSVSTSSTTTPTVAFNGISQYSSDFQAILSKAVQVAQIPVTQLQTQDTTVLSQETALGTLNSAVSALATSLTNIGTLAATGSLGATSSNSSVVSVTDTGATSPATYTINSVTSVAAAASETSTGFYANSTTTPVSTTGTMTLVAGTQQIPIDMSASGHNNLTYLENQINAAGAGVTASILTTSTGNYLSVSANSTGATTLQLFDGTVATGTNILTGTNQGSDAVFQLNNINVDQPGNTVNDVIPGMTFNILAKSATPVTLSLTADPTQLSSDLQDFVTQYNALQTAVVAQTGPSGGALVGDTAVEQIQDAMRQMTSYTTATGTVQSLADLGVQFSDETGQLSFDQTTFAALNSTQISDGLKFIGSTATGFGAFSNTFTEFGDPVTGLIQAEQAGLKQTDTDLQSQISTLNTNIASMQTSLTAQLEAADAQQYELQDQQTSLSASLQGLSLVLYGKDPTTA
jgi:flagellar hook-associated protein 2